MYHLKPRCTVNPLLAALSNYGGPTQTMALLPGSLAIDAGSSDYGGSTDQRGDSRLGNTDIGAFESQGFTIAVSSGNNQSAAVNTAFANPLVVTVTANNSVEPVAGGLITFTAPSSDASAVLTGSPATIGSGGTASVTATANGTTSTYTVSASASGIATPAQFSLTNTAQERTWRSRRNMVGAPIVMVHSWTMSALLRTSQAFPNRPLSPCSALAPSACSVMAGDGGSKLREACPSTYPARPLSGGLLRWRTALSSAPLCTHVTVGPRTDTNPKHPQRIAR
jgi:hypothetical protein